MHPHITVRSLLPALQAALLVEEQADRPIGRVIASDLMSDVLMVDEEDTLLITSLASDQAVRTAQVVGAVAVVLVNGKQPPPSMIALARSLPLTLATSPLTKYEACIAVHRTREAAAADPLLHAPPRSPP